MERKYEARTVIETGNRAFFGAVFDGFMTNLPILVCGIVVAIALVGEFVR